jgi:predicted nucleic acid-binding protein
MLRHLPETSLEENDIGDIIDYVCSVAVRQEIFFLWRPFLKDPGDDLVLEAAVAADCDFIVTYNLRDFVGVDRFDLRALSPGDFLNELRGVK